MITARSKVALSDPSVLSEESDGIPAVRRIGQTACPVLFHAATGASAGSDKVHARPSDPPDMSEARPSGQLCPRAIRSGGHDGRPPDQAVVATHRPIGRSRLPTA